MSFLNKASLGPLKDGPPLSQRGRAGLEFLGTVQSFSSGEMRGQARRDFQNDPDAQELASTWPNLRDDERWSDKIAATRAIARRSPMFRFERLLQRYVAEEIYVRGIPAMEERREIFEELAQPPEGPTLGTLELDADLKLPDYYTATDWHLEIDGWDGYDLYGQFFTYVAGPCIFKVGGYAAVEHGDDITQQRIDVAKQLRRKSYSRIYDAGCGGCSTMAALHKLFPEAELVGGDFSPLLLRNGHIMAERLGIKVQFKQHDSRYTGEPDDSFDAVLMYALMHELPRPVSREVLEEAFRILGPGGEIVISDPPPFRAVDPLQATVLDWDTEHRGEPFFSAACAANWAEELADIGFEQVEEYALGERGYPWVTRGVKPE